MCYVFGRHFLAAVYRRIKSNSVHGKGDHRSRIWQKRWHEPWDLEDDQLSVWAYFNMNIRNKHRGLAEMKKKMKKDWK
jgi:hypothetical protein